MTNSELQAPAEPASISTPLAEELAKRRNQPSSQAADIVNETRLKIEEWRRQRETIQAFATTQTGEAEAAWQVREAARAKAIAAMQEQIALYNADGREDRAAFTGRKQQIEAACRKEIAAVDILIRSHSSVIDELMTATPENLRPDRDDIPF